MKSYRWYQYGIQSKLNGKVTKCTSVKIKASENPHCRAMVTIHWKVILKNHSFLPPKVKVNLHPQSIPCSPSATSPQPRHIRLRLLSSSLLRWGLCTAVSITAFFIQGNVTPSGFPQTPKLRSRWRNTSNTSLVKSPRPSIEVDRETRVSM